MVMEVLPSVASRAVGPHPSLTCTGDVSRSLLLPPPSSTTSHPSPRHSTSTHSGSVKLRALVDSGSSAT